MQVTGWYYKGTIGGGFNYWPDGPRGEPKQITSPMWGRAVVAENEMMFHHAQATGPVAMRTFDHTDDITHDKALNMLIDEIGRRDVRFEMPTDPMTDRAFIAMMSRVFAVNGPTNVPADVNDAISA